MTICTMRANTLVGGGALDFRLPMAVWFYLERVLGGALVISLYTSRSPRSVQIVLQFSKIRIKREYLKEPQGKELTTCMSLW